MKFLNGSNNLKFAGVEAGAAKLIKILTASWLLAVTFHKEQYRCFVDQLLVESVSLGLRLVWV
jgi:hypothetical protein